MLIYHQHFVAFPQSGSWSRWRGEYSDQCPNRHCNAFRSRKEINCARPTRFSLRRTLFVIVTVCASSDCLQMLIYHQHFVGFPQSGFCYESSPVLIATNSSSRCTMVWDKSLGCACSVCDVGRNHARTCCMLGRMPRHARSRHVQCYAPPCHATCHATLCPPPSQRG